MQPLEDNTVRVLAGDEHAEALRAGGEPRRVRSRRLTCLEGQIGDFPEFAADNGSPDLSGLATDLHPHDILDTRRRDGGKAGAAGWCELNLRDRCRAARLHHDT